MEEWALIIVPSVVAAVGVLQVIINVLAGRRANAAAAARDHGSASRDVGEAYGGLVEALERRINALEERVAVLEREKQDIEAWAEALEEENLALRIRVRELESKEVQNGDSNPPVRPGNS